MSSSPGASAIPSRPPSPLPVAGATPRTSPSRVTFPFGVTRSSRARSRSETSASPLAKKAIPHGTSRSSATVPVELGGPAGRSASPAPSGVGRADGRGARRGASRVALGARRDRRRSASRRRSAGRARSRTEGPPPQPARAPAASPAAPSSRRRRARSGGGTIVRVCRGAAVVAQVLPALRDAGARLRLGSAPAAGAAGP